jgi:hypothetical protein
MQVCIVRKIYKFVAFFAWVIFEYFVHSLIHMI